MLTEIDDNAGIGEDADFLASPSLTLPLYLASIRAAAQENRVPTEVLIRDVKRLRTLAKNLIDGSAPMEDIRGRVRAIMFLGSDANRDDLRAIKNSDRFHDDEKFQATRGYIAAAFAEADEIVETVRRILLQGGADEISELRKIEESTSTLPAMVRLIARGRKDTLKMREMILEIVRDGDSSAANVIAELITIEEEPSTLPGVARIIRRVRAFSAREATQITAIASAAVASGEPSRVGELIKMRDNKNTPGYVVRLIAAVLDSSGEVERSDEEITAPHRLATDFLLQRALGETPEIEEPSLP